MNHRADQHPFKVWVVKNSSMFAYIGLALVVALAFYLNNRNQNADEKARCIGAIDTRNVQRQQTDAIYNLAIGAVQRKPTDPPMSKEDTERLNAYIDRVNEFRDKTYALIKPSAPCVPYVTDDDVKPPTPDAAHYAIP